MSKEKKYKCGPNFLPPWVFNEFRFKACCVKHDRAYVNKAGKIKSDIDFFNCTWKQSEKEEYFWMRLRDRVQSILLFLIVILLPFSYVTYLICKFKKK